jgi:soluble lytic murein transglycosylase
MACRRVRLETWALALALGFAALPAGAQVYMYTDERGVVHLSDAPTTASYKPFRSLSLPGGVRPTRAWDGVIARAGRTHKIEPGLVKAVIHTESAFDPKAVSRKGALGLMQLMPRTAAWLGVDDPFDPWQNITGGTRYLRYLMERYEGDLELVLAAYNAGERVVDHYGGIPPYGETQRYVRKVLSLSNRYDADFR